MRSGISTMIKDVIVMLVGGCYSRATILCNEK